MKKISRRVRGRTWNECFTYTCFEGPPGKCSHKRWELQSQKESIHWMRALHIRAMRAHLEGEHEKGKAAVGHGHDQPHMAGFLYLVDHWRQSRDKSGVGAQWRYCSFRHQLQPECAEKSTFNGRSIWEGSALFSHGFEHQRQQPVSVGTKKVTCTCAHASQGTMHT